VALGWGVGMPVSEAVRVTSGRRLQTPKVFSLPAEGRCLLAEGPPRVWALDSASLVRPEDEGAIVVTGSHGGLIGGHPESALRAPAMAAVFNDAGFGLEDAGISRLPALDVRGIAAATVAAASARIGEGCSTFSSGTLSAVNGVARSLGARVGNSTSDFIELVNRASPLTSVRPSA